MNTNKKEILKAVDGLDTPNPPTSASIPDASPAPSPPAPPQPPTRGLGLRGQALVFALFVFLTALATWPLCLHPARVLIGTQGDSLIWPWNYTWTRQAIAVEHRLPFFTEHVFRPYPMLMLHHTHTFFYGGLYTLGAIFYENPYFWNNVFLFFSFVLSGYGTFLLARRLTGQTAAALLAGTIYAFCSYRLERLNCHLTIISSELVPWYLYFLVRGARENRAWLFTAAALCFAATTWNEYYNSLFIILFTLCFALLAWPLRLNHGVRLASRLRALAPGALAAAVCLLPFAWGLWKTVAYHEFTPQQGGERYYVTWLNYLVPAAHHRLLAHWLTPYYRAALPGNETEATVFFGYLAIFLLFYGLIRVRRKSGEQRYFLFCFFLFLILSFGPTLKLGLWGQTWEIALPYRLLVQIPHCDDFRIPARFGNMVALCAGVCAAWGWQALTARIASRRRLALLTGGAIAWVLLENLFAPFPNHYDAFDPARIPQHLMRIVREDPVPGALLKLPPLYGDWTAIWLQTFHHKPSVSGYITRPQPNQTEYIESLDFTDWFTATPNLPRPSPPVDWSPEAVARLCYFFDLRYVLLPPNRELPPGLGPLKKELLPIEREFTEGNAWLALLRKQPPRFPIVIDAGSPVSNYYFTANFTRPNQQHRWLMGPRAQMAIRLDAPRDLVLRAELCDPLQTAAEPQRLRVRVGEKVFAEWAIGPGWSESVCRLPRQALHAGINFIDFEPRVLHPMIARYEGGVVRKLAVLLRHAVIDQAAGAPPPASAAH